MLFFSHWVFYVLSFSKNIVTTRILSNAFSYGGFEAKGAHISGNLYITLQGVFMVLCYCMISGAAGVYTEYVFKNKHEVSRSLLFTVLWNMRAVIVYFIRYASSGRHTLCGDNLCVSDVYICTERIAIFVRELLQPAVLGI